MMTTGPSGMNRIEFAPFDIQDALPYLVQWLADPDVRRWYDAGEPTPENLSDKFAPDPAKSRYTIQIDGYPVGYIQLYRLRDYSEYQRQVGVDPDAVAIDLFIGDPAYRNRGWGANVLRACVDRIVFGQMNASLVMIAPDPANLRAVRSYGKAGFRSAKTVRVLDENPANAGEELVMLMTREDQTPS
ncbi:MAG TPA: GNAT family N-acetyltransferase [Thermomicrobiales bacterium]|nr:GNAT family N-acetyltransferase [Thermomicrobiales bacterium]